MQCLYANVSLSGRVCKYIVFFGETTYRVFFFRNAPMNTGVFHSLFTSTLCVVHRKTMISTTPVRHRHRCVVVVAVMGKPKKVIVLDPRFFDTVARRCIIILGVYTVRERTDNNWRRLNGLWRLINHYHRVGGHEHNKFVAGAAASVTTFSVGRVAKRSFIKRWNRVFSRGTPEVRLRNPGELPGRRIPCEHVTKTAKQKRPWFAREK